TDAVLTKQKEKLLEQVERESKTLHAIQDRVSLEQQLQEVGTNAANMILPDGITDAGKPLFGLLTNREFPKMVATWLTAFRPADRAEAESGLSVFLADELTKAGALPGHIEIFKSSYFDRIEKHLFSNPVLSNWRTSLALNAVLEKLDLLDGIIRQEGQQTRGDILAQLDELQALTAKLAAAKAHGESERFSRELRVRALEQYKILALESCDIIDLANLPESDRHLAARELALRRLYVPLRINVEFAGGFSPDDSALVSIEKNRALLRNRKIAPLNDGEEKKLASVGHRLQKANRLVLLGDPGAGKTTIIRWIATAYLLRLKQDPAFKALPDVASLPEREWLPIVVRCRDLGEAGRSGSLDDVLEETFRKAQMADDEAAALPAVMRELLAEGKALLLVDGLDEISDPGARSRFCQLVERFHIAFPNAPVIVTSRIVGYREMRYRIGRGFEHATVAEFSKKDKDEFARRWCELTEVPERIENACADLIRDIHSADRIERLTGNPMLLTTMALVKRKVGKLPSRRADLYWEAVSVLLNWRAEVDEPIDHREAFPQLQFVAYEMCRRGVQRLREDEILELMERLRMEFPNIRAVKRHEPDVFLRLLERRTGIISEVGEVKHKGRPVPVFEFRSRTFQEYFAALALVDGVFSGRVKGKSLAEQIAPLAGEMERSKNDGELVIKDNWREVLRLCVACCGDDDVDEVLSAVLTPLEGEDKEKTARPRAMLAALCLADEPNAGAETAHEVLRVFAQNVGDDDGEGNSEVDAAIKELVGSKWKKMLRLALTR
ncbi:MAG: NACHT domain-containing protein, partial [bacterium]|nr:NACHT domain-containing protein [bacterium]